MRTLIRFSTAAAGLLLTGATLAAGPVNPPPPSCGFTEVLTCVRIDNQIICSCEPRDISSGPLRNDEPRALIFDPAGDDELRALKGKPQHLVP